ncbi:MAG: OsmC family protein [Chloroflexi bacterium]|nr:OsmC family protein [Chloroflexota bacterium]
MGKTNTAKIIWKGERLHFRGELGSGYEFDISGQSNAENGGSAMEFLLAGVAGCTAMDVVHVLRKKRQKVSGVEIEISGVRADETPAVYTEADILYIVRGQDISAKAVEQAIELSQTKYCSASIMFKQAGVTVRTDYRIE